MVSLQCALYTAYIEPFGTKFLHILLEVIKYVIVTMFFCQQCSAGNCMYMFWNELLYTG
jgi:hypothetical protein